MICDGTDDNILTVANMLTVDDAIVNRINDDYASWNVDSSANRGFFHTNFSNTNLHAAVAALAPSVLRFGGSGNDFLEYKLGAGAPCAHANNSDTYGCLNATHWDALHSLSATAL